MLPTQVPTAGGTIDDIVYGRPYYIIYGGTIDNRATNLDVSVLYYLWW